MDQPELDLTIGKRIAVIEINQADMSRQLRSGNSRMDKIEKSISNTGETIDTVKVDIFDIKRVVDKIDLSISGNGVKGINDRLNVVEEKTDEHDSFFDQAKGAIFVIKLVGLMTIITLLIAVWKMVLG